MPASAMDLYTYITLWFSANAIDAWRPGLSGLPGGPRKYSDGSIEIAVCFERRSLWATGAKYQSTLRGDFRDPVLRP